MRVLLLVLALFGPIEQLDRDVAGAVQHARRPALEGPMRFASQIGQPMVVIGGLVVVAVLEGTLGAGTARVALVALAGANLTTEALKRLTFRARPDGSHKRSNASFPSGHATSAAALAWVLGRRWRKAAPFLGLFALWVCYSRMYLNRHWLSDVVVGVAIGILWGWLAWRWLAPQAKRERPGEQPPLAAAGPQPAPPDRVAG